MTTPHKAVCAFVTQPRPWVLSSFQLTTYETTYTGASLREKPAEGLEPPFSRWLVFPVTLTQADMRRGATRSPRANVQVAGLLPLCNPVCIVARATRRAKIVGWLEFLHCCFGVP